MKCLVIHSSYRKGNTYKVTQLVQSYMEESGCISFEEVFLSKLNLPFCIGCNQCFLKGEEYCPHSSIIQPIVKKISECDAFIITAPTYSLQVPGVLKCWLDHMSYFFHRPQFFTKKALVITTTAGAGAKSTAHYIRNVLQFWGMNQVSILPIRCSSFNYHPNEKGLKQMHLVAEKFYREITSPNLHTPNVKQLFIFNFWRAMAQAGQEKGTKDYQYWDLAKWLDKPFHQDIPLNHMQKTWATFVYILCGKILK